MRLSLPITTYIKKFSIKKIIGDVLYSNGLINNGSHYRIYTYSFGKIGKIKVINKVISNFNLMLTLKFFKMQN